MAFQLTSFGVKCFILRYHIRRECVYVNLLELSSEAREWAKDIQSRLFHDTICTALAEYPDSMQLLTIFINSEV